MFSYQSGATFPWTTTPFQALANYRNFPLPTTSSTRADRRSDRVWSSSIRRTRRFDPIKDLTHLAGGIIVLRGQEVVLYLNAGDRATKPNGALSSYQPVPFPLSGQGLSQVTICQLDRCWARDKLTREYIRDVLHPRFELHLDKFNSQPGTTFVDFGPSTGT